MRLRLTKAEFEALLRILRRFDEEGEPKGMQAKLLFILMMEIYQKLQLKTIRRKITKEYKLQLKEQEALAFWVFFHRYPINDFDIYEQNLINQLSNFIHQTFS